MRTSRKASKQPSVRLLSFIGKIIQEPKINGSERHSEGKYSELSAKSKQALGAVISMKNSPRDYYTNFTENQKTTRKEPGKLRRYE